MATTTYEFFTAFGELMTDLVPFFIAIIGIFIALIFVKIFYRGLLIFFSKKIK